MKYNCTICGSITTYPIRYECKPCRKINIAKSYYENHEANKEKQRLRKWKKDLKQLDPSLDDLAIAEAANQINVEFKAIQTIIDDLKKTLPNNIQPHKDSFRVEIPRDKIHNNSSMARRKSECSKRINFLATIIPEKDGSL